MNITKFMHIQIVCKAWDLRPCMLPENLDPWRLNLRVAHHTAYNFKGEIFADFEVFDLP